MYYLKYKRNVFNGFTLYFALQINIFLVISTMSAFNMAYFGNMSLTHLFFGSVTSVVAINDRTDIVGIETVTSSNGTSSNRTYTINNTLCGFPAFCSNTAMQDCNNTRLIDCDVCDTSLAYFFFVFALLLSLVIVLSNVAVMVTVTHQNHQLTNVDIQRFSLAVADSLTGM